MKNFKIGAFLLAFMILSTNISFANPKDDSISVEKAKVIEESYKPEKSFVNKPKDFEINTTKDTVVISGYGKENDKVKITLYKREGDSYVLMGEAIDIKIGALGVFTKEISLKDSKGKGPKEAVVSKDTFIVLELKRGEQSVWDYRVVRFADEKEVKQSLESLKVTTLVPSK